MKRTLAALLAASFLAAGAGCALRSSHVLAAATDAQEFVAWDCPRIQRELDRVQRQATRMAYAFDERAGNNIVAMGLGMSVFWPALLTMRPTQPEAGELAALKGRFEALTRAGQQRPCSDALAAAELQELAVHVGDVLTYEQRAGQRGALRQWSVAVGLVARQGLELQAWPARVPIPSDAQAEAKPADWIFDRSGNLLRAPISPVWPQLLRGELELGSVVSGELADPSDSFARARVRGQVVAVGPQLIGGRQFDAAVIDLFGDAHGEVASARLDGVLVVDRRSGLLLRLDLFSPHAAFQFQRRLARIQAQP